MTTPVSSPLAKMQYKLINKQTGESHLCDRLSIGGFEYYVSGEKINEELLFIDKNNIFRCRNIFDEIGVEDDNGLIHQFESSKKVIATTNPNIDCPKVVDEVEKLAKKYTEETESLRMKRVWKAGYKKSQETHPNSDEDMIEFHKWAFQQVRIKESDLTTKELLQLWKEQKTKTIYYE